MLASNVRFGKNLGPKVKSIIKKVIFCKRRRFTWRECKLDFFCLLTRCGCRYWIQQVYNHHLSSHSNTKKHQLLEVYGIMACHRFPQSLITFMSWSLQKMKATLYLHHFSTSSERVRHLRVTTTILGNRKNERWKELAFDLYEDVSRTKETWDSAKAKLKKGPKDTQKLLRSFSHIRKLPRKPLKGACPMKPWYKNEMKHEHPPWLKL